ncbi:MAG: zinc ribbon domain-containing protein [Methanobacterium paludis]|nr:zinc ribbon domain-containing protein [Methanobacterium paludis]
MIFVVYCSQCGEKNPDGAKYCFSCGAHLIYEKDIEDDSKKSLPEDGVPEDGVPEDSAKDVEPRLKDVKLVGDDVEHLESLNKENFQKDMDTLKACNHERS